jgi:hypothetical protein
MWPEEWRDSLLKGSPMKERLESRLRMVEQVTPYPPRPRHTHSELEKQDTPCRLTNHASGAAEWDLRFGSDQRNDHESIVSVRGFGRG